MSEQHFVRTLEAIVLSWLEVKEGRPSFQKRTYKDRNKFEAYLSTLLSTKQENIDNIQIKECYKILPA